MTIQISCTFGDTHRDYQVPVSDTTTESILAAQKEARRLFAADFNLTPGQAGFIKAAA